jgi:type IV secretory pathway TrbD component
MRGTPRITNKALSAPQLTMGCETSLFVLCSFFWGWAFIGVLPHWPSVFIIFCWVGNIYLLRFAAKKDPQFVAVFRKNSRFLLQQRFYLARGYAGNVQQAQKLQTVPVKITSKL